MTQPRGRSRVAVAIVAVATSGLVATAFLAREPLMHAAGLRGGPLPPASSTQFSPTGTPSPAASGPSADPATMRPAALASASVPVDPAKLSQRVTSVPRRFGGRSSAMVLDTATGRVLHQDHQSELFTPASNMKTLTVLGALHSMESSTQFETSVTSPTPGRLVLRGGGDPFLRTVPDPKVPELASLRILAELTAKQLKEEGRTSVTLGFDDSLFTGPAWAPSWPAHYNDQVTPISALMVDGGRGIRPDGTVTNPARSQTPALAAAQAFAAQLKTQGITVTGSPTAARAAGDRVASVQSAELDQLVTLAMVHSDNTATEMLLRQVARASGRPGSFDGGTQALQSILDELGIWQQGAVLRDGCGLSRGTRITPTMLVGAWQKIATTPRLRTLVTATPVAGVSGTLHDRFLVDEALGGRGRVHAKTGTLSEISSLSGWTVTRSGQSLVVVLMVNESKNDWWARAWIDTVAARISECGCS